ncbi:hypothetical protein BO70DRAFT_21729 [Aspergillus heteromorphus CBS 117.55]|uniref:Uncharacterized protein n=1 Tax=Aspergillus heteromorphus CBS 117.55 TaxID=1448321 RepID=A0A317X2X7_9EURO|nr:uncharacterized protein BO70DRAFT_21729 [Aspergillus heteromorphus CBS 117.55]PWY92916.1 hypothetical protein BO70DRAFT_21729 [Aspergillus heteromorphus CBS 117.55]
MVISFLPGDNGEGEGDGDGDGGEGKDNWTRGWNHPGGPVVVISPVGESGKGKKERKDGSGARAINQELTNGAGCPIAVAAAPPPPQQQQQCSSFFSSACVSSLPHWLVLLAVQPHRLLPVEHSPHTNPSVIPERTSPSSASVLPSYPPSLSTFYFLDLLFSPLLLPPSSRSLSHPHPLPLPLSLLPLTVLSPPPPPPLFTASPVLLCSFRPPTASLQ